METEIGKVKEWLSSPLRIVVAPHRKPDGDAIGSALAMYHFLKGLGHEVAVVSPNDYAGFLHFLPADDQVINFEKKKRQAKALINKADIIFLLDFNDLKRLDDMGGTVEKATARRIMIDHHPYPIAPVDYRLLETSASSTAELVYHFIHHLGMEDRIDKTVAECIYAGICSDTGRFKYNVQPKVHRVVADLLEKDINADDINGQLFDTFSEDRLRLTGYSLYEKLKVYPEYHTAIIYLSKADLKTFNYKTGDSEGLVNLALSVEGTRFAALVIETETLVKLSLRSKGNFAVNSIAQEYFNGGGHLNAAGGSSKVGLQATLKKLESLLPEYAAELC